MKAVVMKNAKELTDARKEEIRQLEQQLLGRQLDAKSFTETLDQNLNPSNFLIGLEDPQGKLIAIAHLTDSPFVHNNVKQLYIKQMVVDKDHRGKGYGKQLKAAIADYAKKDPNYLSAMAPITLNGAVANLETYVRKDGAQLDMMLPRFSVKPVSVQHLTVQAYQLECIVKQLEILTELQEKISSSFSQDEAKLTRVQAVVKGHLVRKHIPAYKEQLSSPEPKDWEAFIKAERLAEKSKKAETMK